MLGRIVRIFVHLCGFPQHSLLSWRGLRNSSRYLTVMFRLSVQNLSRATSHFTRPDHDVFGYYVFWAVLTIYGCNWTDNLTNQINGLDPVTQISCSIIGRRVIFFPPQLYFSRMYWVYNQSRLDALLNMKHILPSHLHVDGRSLEFRREHLPVIVHRSLQHLCLGTFKGICQRELYQRMLIHQSLVSIGFSRSNPLVTISNFVFGTKLSERLRVLSFYDVEFKANLLILLYRSLYLSTCIEILTLYPFSSERNLDFAKLFLNLCHTSVTKYNFHRDFFSSLAVFCLSKTLSYIQGTQTRHKQVTELSIGISNWKTKEQRLTVSKHFISVAARFKEFEDLTTINLFSPLPFKQYFILVGPKLREEEKK